MLFEKIQHPPIKQHGSQPKGYFPDGSQVSCAAFVKPLLLAFCLSFSAADIMASDQFLDTCLKIAEARDKKLAVAAEQVELSKVRKARSARGFFPSLIFERQYSRGKTITEDYEAEQLGLRASQVLYEGGKTRATYLYDSLTLDLAQFNYTKTREELFYKIKLAYYDMLSSNTEYIALQKSFDEITRLMNKVKIEYRAKAISELDLIEAENFRDKVENLLKASEENLILAHKKLTVLANVDSLDDVPVMVPEGLTDDVPEISFTLNDCMGYVTINNLDIKAAQMQSLMADQKRKVNRAKLIPKFYVEGSYGQSGEAYVSMPLSLATVWSVAGRMSWTLWGNTMEVLQSSEHTVPTSIVDISNKVSDSVLDVKVSLFDDMNYFVDAKEGGVTYEQALSEYKDTRMKVLLDLQKAYNDYNSSLRSARTVKKEIALRKRKLDLLRKRNELYEVQTVQVMEESWKYADAISAYGRAVTQNYASVSEMERLTMIPLR